MQNILGAILRSGLMRRENRGSSVPKTKFIRLDGNGDSALAVW